MSRKYLQTKKTTLSYSISDSETSIRLDSLVKLNGDSIAASDIGDLMYFTIDPGTSKEEICSITSAGVTINSDGTVDLVNVVRGLKEIDPYTTGGFSSDHSTGSVVVFSNNPQLYASLANKYNDNTFEGLNIFEQAPQSEVDPVSPNDLTRLSYVQALVLGQLTTINVIVPGKAGETVAAGNAVYFDETDNEWKKTDAGVPGTVNNVLLGIAQGAGVDGGAIANGVLLQGVDDNQSGMVEGDVQYFGNTAGSFSNTPGTTEVTAGIAKSTTEIYFNPRFNQMLTEDQQDAIAGANSPSASNVFLTQNDSSSTPSANKLAKYDANAGLAATQINATYPLGESFTGATTPQPAVVIDDLLQPLFDGVTSFGAAASPQVACKIVPRQTSTIASLITMFTRTTDPSTNLSIEIQTDNAGAPSGTPVTNGTSATIATSTLKNTEYRYFNFTFATPPSVTAGTTYWVVFKTSATNANQITVPSLTNAKKYASFSGSSYNGTVWSANQPIPYFEIICATGGSKSLWVSDGNGVEPIGNYHGFCITTGSAGASGTLVKQGLVGGFSGLAVGSDYYMSNTVGTLTLNKNEGVFLGTAISATQLLVPAVKYGFRNINYYTTIVVSGEAGNAFYSLPYYAYEDGYFTIHATAGMKNNTRAYLNAYVLVSYANATAPATVPGDLVGSIQTFDNTDGQGVIVLPVKKGERIQLTESNAGGAGNSPSISKVTFVPKA